jgi:hypothetical protein
VSYLTDLRKALFLVFLLFHNVALVGVVKRELQNLNWGRRRTGGAQKNACTSRSFLIDAQGDLDQRGSRGGMYIGFDQRPRYILPGMYSSSSLAACEVLYGTIVTFRCTIALTSKRLCEACPVPLTSPPFHGSQQGGGHGCFRASWPGQISHLCP